MKAPVNPTLVPTNPVHDKYTIQFAPELVDFIKEGKKLMTYRFGDKYAHLKPGDSVQLCEYGTGNLITKATITKVEATSFKDLPLAIDEHEVYESKEHQRIVFSNYYKYIGRPLLDDDKFLVISYELVI